ncbi:MAG: VanW family protein [Actinomycetota bacterium]|nr:VanW family protein [Actinomycetota bacterium]
MTTATLARRLTLPVGGGPFRRGLLMGMGAGLLLAVVLFVGLSLGVTAINGSAIMPRTSVGGIQLAGLDRPSAEARLRANLPSLTSGHATIAVSDKNARVEYAEIGRGYELGQMLDAAWSVGRSGGLISDALSRVRSLLADTSLPVVVHAYDAAAIGAAAQRVAATFSVAPGDASVVASKGTFAVTAGHAGVKVDAAQIRAALASAVATTDPADVVIQIAPTAVEPDITTQAARSAAAAATRIAVDLDLVVGAKGDEDHFPVKAATVAGWIGFGPDYGVAYAVRLDKTKLTAAIAALVEKVDRDAKDAGFTLAGGGPGSVIPAETGRKLNVDESVQAVLASLKQRGEGAATPFARMVVSVTQPQLTTEKAQAALSKMQMLSGWTTYYVPDKGNGFGNNINIPAQDIDGRVLAPGEWFDFWSSIGPINEARGFSYGGVIIGGRSFGTAIGGGICSTSTTLFNAALRAGLQIGDRMNHYYYINRYPVGLDATVYMDETWRQTMSFRNDTEWPVLIRGYGGVGTVRFEVWSVPNGRSVVLSDPITGNYRSAIETTQVSTDLAPGQSVRKEYAHDGFDATVTRTVYDARGAVIHADTFFSGYGVVNGVTLVGPSAPAPSASPKPSPSP